jgi:hypothetical protein
VTSLLRLLNAYCDESDYTVLSHVTSVSNSCTFGEFLIIISPLGSMLFVDISLSVYSFLTGMLKHF